MSGPWAASIPVACAHRVASLRLRPGVRARASVDEVWLRGEHADAELDLALRMIPAARRYHVDSAGRHVPAGARVPTGSVPEQGWVALETWCSVTWPSAVLPGAPLDRVRLRLVRDSGMVAPTVLLTSLERWVRYATHAAEVRLRPLRFACDGGRVVVWGDPLAPLRGRRFAVTSSVAVPIGFRLDPALPGEDVARIIALGEGDLALFEEDGTHEVVPASGFVDATRGAARQTMARRGDA